MGTSLRVVFDTNTFTPNAFDLLEKSAMHRLCKSRRIIPIYGHVFLEETLQAYGAENKRQELVNRWLPFIIETVDYFCNDLTGIWHKELIQGKGQRTNIFMNKRDQERFVSRLPNIPLDGSWHVWHNSQQDRGIENAKRAKQRQTSIVIRKEIADWRKTNSQKHGVSRLDQYLECAIHRHHFN